LDPAGGTDNDVSVHSVVAEKGSKSDVGGLKRLPLSLFGLGIVLVVDLERVLLYNYETTRDVPRVSAKDPVWGYYSEEFHTVS